MMQGMKRRWTSSPNILVLGCVLWSAGFIGKVCGQAQTFREAPADTDVIRGSMAILKCSINNMKGTLQWTKDGFGLGLDRTVPGYPRYDITGNVGLGEHNLMIRGAKLVDDAEFQCQVTPGGGDPPLLGPAKLNVLIPPEHPEIDSYENGTKVNVPHKQETVNLTCTSKNGKPAPKLSWFRNGEEITDGIAYSVEDLGNKLQTAKSMLTWNPNDEDNDAYFMCRAQNKALLDPLETVVQMSVMHPPSPPRITGYRTGQVVKTEDTLKLLCVSEGGNPLAQVYWYKNDLELDFSYEFGDNKAQNELIFTVQPDDNEAVYKCEATNTVTPKPLTAEVKLTVQFAPERVTITGHRHAKAGETIMLSCESAISNPPAVISWHSLGQEVGNAQSYVIPSPQGGFVTMSNVTVTLTESQNNVDYQCHAVNEAMGTDVFEAVQLEVTYPPGQPTISGYTEGREVTAGNPQILTCTSVGGNPPATLTWWKGDELLTSTQRRTGNIVSSQLRFLLDASDNQADYRCNATNPATIDPLLASVTLTVNFPPKSLEITTSPKNPKAGQTLRITCKSATSNPASQLSWWKDGMELLGLDGGIVEAEFGGKSTISRLELTPTAADNGQIYACNAMNILLERAVSDAVTLNILFPPQIPADIPTKMDIVEFQSGILNLTILANPSDCTYTWFRDGQKLAFGNTKTKRDISIPHFLVEGSVLNITNVTRADSGLYTLEAGNSQGKTNITVNINVHYQAGISSLTKSLIVDDDNEAIFECVVDANPVTDGMIKWMRPGYDMSRVVVTVEGAKSTLTIKNVTKLDSGVFVCTADNSIGETATANAELIVKYAPEIEENPALAKAAADKGGTGQLVCRAEGAPLVEFVWYKSGATVDSSSAKYKTEAKKLNIVRYESSLFVYNVTKSDYSSYVCKAKNDLGEDTWNIVLDGTSRPDAPFNLKFINASHNGITLSWEPGFHGGASQRFQVRYTIVGEEGSFKYEDVVPPNGTIYTVTGLKMATQYELTVRGINRLGEGAFQPKPLLVTTAVAPQTGQYGEADDVPLLIILTVSIFGILLLGLNVLLILCYIHRRKKKVDKDASESASQANTVEMYGAPTITEDSKSYTTYDRRSLDDFPDEYGPYPDDEMKRFLPPPRYTDSYGSSKPNLYGPLPPSPVDQQRAFLASDKGSIHDPVYDVKQPIYDVKQPGGPAWEPRNRGPYSAGSLPQGMTLPRPVDDDQDYANQLRQNQVQKSLGPQPLDPAKPVRIKGRREEAAAAKTPTKKPMRDTPPAPPTPSNQDSTSPKGKSPPPPPTRSSSKGATEGMSKNMPPLPSRNYGPEDIPQAPNYPAPPPPPGVANYSSSPRRPGHPSKSPPDMRGALV